MSGRLVTEHELVIESIVHSLLELKRALKSKNAATVGN